MRVALALCCPLAASASFWGARQSAFIGAAPAGQLSAQCAWAGRTAQRGSTPAVWEPKRSSRLSMTDAVTVEPEATEAAETPAAEAKAPKQKRTPLSALSPGSEFTGKVKGIKDFGIFVDFGAESDGLVHISQMSANFVSNPSDIAKMGDSVTVRILTVDADKKQVALTMKTEAEASAPRPKRGKRQQEKAEDDEEEEDAPDTDVLKDAPVGEKDVSAFENFDPKKMLDGQVVSTQAYGAFVRLDGHDVDGLIPTQDMMGDLKIGQKIQVRITDVDNERKRITLSNIPLLRGKRSRFAMVGNQQDDEDLGVVARRAGLYPSELPDPFEGPDNDIDWEQAFAFGAIEEAGVEGVTEDEVATFGEEEVEEDEEFAMGSIEVFRSPAYKRERGLLTEEEEAAFFPDTDAMDAYKAGEADESYFLDEDDEDDPEPTSAFYQMYESQIPQLTEEEIKGAIRKAQGTRVNVIEQWEEEVAQEREYMSFNSKPTSRKSKDHMAVTVSPTTADVASEKIRVPIYFSKKMSKLKQVELLEEIEKLAAEDPLALAGRP